MNADEIRNMPAGREMDDLVAVKVFGWYLDKLNHMTRKTVISPMLTYCEFDVPHYSTDISAAWKVAEKMREMGYAMTISNYGDGYKVWFVRNGAIYGYRSEDDKSAPFAICREALMYLSHYPKGAQL